MNKKIIRITTAPMALRYLLSGQMKYIRANGFDVVMISSNGEEREALIEREGCLHIIVPLTRKITPFTDLVCLYRLIKIFRQEKPDIVHTHTPKAGLLGMLAAKITGVKIRIHTVAGLPLMTKIGLKLLLIKKMEKLTYWCANHVWPNSMSLLRYIKAEKLVAEKKLKLIGNGSSNGINIERFDLAKIKIHAEEIKRNIHYNAENFYLLYVGRIVKDKGIVELITAFKSLKQQYPQLKLILLGKFEMELDPLPHYIYMEIKTNPDIIYVGFTPHVEYYISLAHLFIFPSHREGFPNVLLQAGLLKVPIICSEIVGNIDIVEDDVTGTLFSAGNVEEIKKKVIFAINSPEAIKEMSEKLYEKIIYLYKQEIVWKLILEEYNKLLNVANI